MCQLPNPTQNVAGIAISIMQLLVKSLLTSHIFVSPSTKLTTYVHTIVIFIDAWLQSNFYYIAEIMPLKFQSV